MSLADRFSVLLIRYKVLVTSLKFDDSQIRDHRKANDKAAAISDIFDVIIINSQANYYPSAYDAIDAMLIYFRR